MLLGLKGRYLGSRTMRPLVACLGLCTALAVLSTIRTVAQMRSDDEWEPLGPIFVGHAVSWYACGVFMPLLIGLARHFPISPRRWLLPLLAHLAVCGLLAILSLVIFYAIGSPIERGPFAFAAVTQQDFFGAFAMLLALAAISHAYLFERESRTTASSVDSLERELADIRAAPAASDETPAVREYFTARTAAGTRFVRPDDIIWIDAQGNYARLHLHNGSVLIRETMSKLEAMLDMRKFARIHRSVIVGVAHVVRIQSRSHGEYLVSLSDGSEIASSRSYTAAIARLRN